MNYIRHLNAFFSFVRSDKRLACSHVSLYVALFQYWNFNRFQNPFPIYRDNLMQLSKIGSKNTYHKCIKELHQAGYIIYHPSIAKFQEVKISMLRLDIKEEEIKKYQQLDLFNEGQPPSQKGVMKGEDSGTKIDTVSVPLLTAMCPKNDTGTVPKMGHNIKHKHFIKESKTPAQKIFDKNQRLSEGVNKLGAVPKSVHGSHYNPPLTGEGTPGENHSRNATAGKPIPIEKEVEEFFAKENYPPAEAKKFFNHYKATGWKIKGITPIEDWEAAAHKWILNAASFENKMEDNIAAPKNDIETLYSQFLAGKKIFQQITPVHFKELKLQLTNELMGYAWQQRINQLTGSNQNTTLQLLQAYQDKKENDPLLAKDNPNLVTLAKRIAVIAYFNELKQNNVLTLKSNSQ